MPKKEPGSTPRQRNQKGNSSRKGQGLHANKGGKGARHIDRNQELAASRNKTKNKNKK